MKLLWIGDGGVSSGFARVTHNVLDRLPFEKSVLAINYRGDPHPYDYDLYTCQPGGDLYGIGRLPYILNKVRPGAIVILSDPWNVGEYVKEIKQYYEQKEIICCPIVASMPVDGLNFAHDISGVDSAIFWTHFGLKEARKGGYTGLGTVIPLGVDTEIYKPHNKMESRKRLGLPAHTWDKFIVGNVNRNQPRKRLDLTVEYFMDWVKSCDVEDAMLYVHIAPTGDPGYEIVQLMSYYEGQGRLITVTPELVHGCDEDLVALTYSAFDVQITTSQGEGWGLTTMEGMACGIPQIVPDWAALGEWCRGQHLVECTSVAVTPNYVNVIGGIPNKGHFVEALNEAYCATEIPDSVSQVRQEQYKWESIAMKYKEVILAARPK